MRRGWIIKPFGYLHYLWIINNLALGMHVNTNNLENHCSTFIIHTFLCSWVNSITTWLLNSGYAIMILESKVTLRPCFSSHWFHCSGRPKSNVLQAIPFPGWYIWGPGVAFKENMQRRKFNYRFIAKCSISFESKSIVELYWFLEWFEFQHQV